MILTLLFTLGEEVYGLEVDAIQEIVEDPSLHFVPRAEGILTGAINFHNQILEKLYFLYKVLQTFCIRLRIHQPFQL